VSVPEKGRSSRKEPSQHRFVWLCGTQATTQAAVLHARLTWTPTHTRTSGDVFGGTRAFRRAR
jgi:hypothetical protein